jgi:hypothetical protein
MKRILIAAGLALSTVASHADEAPWDSPTRRAIALRDDGDFRKLRSLSLLADEAHNISAAINFSNVLADLVMKGDAVVYGHNEAPKIEQKREEATSPASALIQSPRRVGGAGSSRTPQ